MFLSTVADMLDIGRLSGCPRPLSAATQLPPASTAPAADSELPAAGSNLTAAGSGHDPAVLALLAEARALLSGPGLQYWLGQQVVAARLRLTAGELVQGPCYGLLDPHLPLPLPEDSKSRSAQLALGAASAVWGITVSGPLPPRVAQPPAGWLPAVHPTAVAEPVEAAVAGTAATAAGEAAALHAPNRGVPYSAVNVYDMTHATVTAVLANVDVVSYQSPALGLTYPPLPDAALLLVRLVLELRPRQTALRLPALWRTLACVLAGLQPTAFEGAHPASWLLQLTGLLLRLEVPDEAAGTQKDAFTAEAVAGLTAGGVPGAQAGGSAGAGAQTTAGDEPVKQAGGQGGITDTRTAGVAAASCCCSLRCALDGGVLPAVEQLLRGLLAPLARTCAGLKTGSVETYLLAINSLLRYSGVWPAVLAHGSVRQAASLVLTLRKAVRELNVVGEMVGYVALAGTLGLCLQLQPGNCSLAVLIHHGYLSALLEQSVAVLPTLRPLLPVSTATAAEFGGGGDNRLSCAAQLLLPPSSRAASHGPLTFNDSLEPSSAPMDLQWLVRAGGRPPPGSPAAQQQRELAVFALTQWLPDVLSGLPGDPASIRANCRLLLLPALQCLIAWQRLEVAQQAGSGGSSSSCSSRDNGSGSSCSGDKSFDSWRTLLLQDLVVVRWLRRVLYIWSYGEEGGADEQRSGSQQQEQRQQEGQVAAGERSDAEAAALDLLEVMAVLSVDLWHLFQPVETQCSAPEEGGGSSSGSAPQVLPRHLRHLEGMLVRHGRHLLLAALAEMSHSLAAAEDGAGGSPGGSSSSGKGAAGSALAALRLEVAAKHDLARLHVLPSPAAAAQVVAAAGVVLCGNPQCINLEGPSEVELVSPATHTAAPGQQQQQSQGCSSSTKTCSRCRAVHYCSGACCWKHWQEGGHKEECAGMRAAEGANSSTFGGGDAHRQAAAAAPAE